MGEMVEQPDIQRGPLSATGKSITIYDQIVLGAIR